MNSLTLTQKLAFGLLGLWGLCSIGTTPVFAGECAVTDAASLDSCKDQNVKTSGFRLGMFDVPEYFMFADPGFTGGEGLQDYMELDDETPIILHTNDEVQCPEKIEVKGTLKQMDLEGEKAWVIKVSEFKCSEP
ncbi:MAG: hypothetical protein DRR08_08995 [Candidatus Parabeggiatoa sp. nov. 2]|nr:MAG: hypothetical protein B6247_11325 [Beggiatoa sp. 4572_84]RKZ61338.1 MAG: hypothetical protein DRR08_08995 [Gammaproteobacteria bacterium]